MLKKQSTLQIKTNSNQTKFDHCEHADLARSLISSSIRIHINHANLELKKWFNLNPPGKKTNLYNIFSKGLRVQSLWIMGFLSWGDHQMEVSQNRATTCHQSSRHRWSRLTKPMVTTGESPLPAASQGIPWKSMGMSVDPSRDASSFKETNYTWKKSEKLTTLALACFSEGYRNMRKLLWRWQLPKTNGHNVCGASDHLKQRQANMALFFCGMYMDIYLNPNKIHGSLTV